MNVPRMLIRLLVWLCCSLPVVAQPRHGDLIFHHSSGRRAALIAGVTGSGITHCGIVVHRGGRLDVLEAVGPVTYTPLATWIDRGQHRRYALYRLKPKGAAEKLVRAAQVYLGKGYDDRYVLGGDELYCSELLYRAACDGPRLQLVRPQALKELNWRPWSKEIRALRNGNLPLQELLVSPVALTRSPLLSRVYDDLSQ